MEILIRNLALGYMGFLENAEQITIVWMNTGIGESSIDIGSIPWSRKLARLLPAITIFMRSWDRSCDRTRGRAVFQFERIQREMI
jgi:hypothetical protein